MNIKALIGLLLVGGVILVLGIGLGVLFSGGKTVTPAQIQSQTIPNAVKLLSSKVVPAVMARGTVTKVEGMNVTLMYDSNSQPVTIKSDANISALIIDPKSPVNKPKYTTQPATFGDIKVTDNLEVMVKVLPDGRVEGFKVTILPAPAVAPAATK